MPSTRLRYGEPPWTLRTISWRPPIGWRLKSWCIGSSRSPLWLAVDEGDRPLAFVLLKEGHMEALFAHPAHHGRASGPGSSGTAWAYIRQ
jgi:hypothetical protein